MAYRIIFKRYLNSKTVNLECFNIPKLFNTLMGQLSKISISHEVLNMYYPMQVQQGQQYFCASFLAGASVNRFW